MALALPKLSTTKAPLKDRIKALQAEIDSIVDEIVEKDVGCGLPRQSLRNMLTRGSGCQCAIYDMLASEGKLK
jgi:hypothetical protein